MDILKNKHDILISLGSTCYVKNMLNKHVSQKTYMFDWIGSSMWGLCEIIEHNFKDIFNKNNYKYMATVENRHLMVVNTSKYLIFTHDFPQIPVNDQQKDILQQRYLNDDTFVEFTNKYIRRITDFQNLLNGQNKILFIRHEQYMMNRKIYPEYEKYFVQSELQYLIKFTDLLKVMYPTLKFNILYLSHTHQNKHLIDNNIIILNTPLTDWNECANVFTNVIIHNKDYLSQLNM